MTNCYKRDKREIVQLQRSLTLSSFKMFPEKIGTDYLGPDTLILMAATQSYTMFSIMSLESTLLNPNRGA